MRSERPNILLIFTDQQRADTIRDLGNEIIQTPALDRLCREGTAFTRAYTPSPVCVPARCSLMHGLYPHNTGCNDNDCPAPEGRPNLMGLLSDAGYKTHGIGKMHFTPDAHGLNGFGTRERQEELSGSSETDEYRRYLSDKGYAHVFDANGQRSEMYYIPQISQLPARDHPTQWVGDRAQEFLAAQDGREPFCLMASFIHPHPPFAPPTPWNKLYRTADMPDALVPEGYEGCLTHANRNQNRYKYRDGGIDRNLVRTLRAFYYGCISFIDYQVGRMVAQLEANGLLDDTLIVFTSDHGEMLGDYNSFGKRSMLDAAARIPLIARLPGVFAVGGRCAEPASLVDIMPTILGQAGIDAAPLGLDGVRLDAVAAGPSSSGREHVLSQFSWGANGLYMVATATQKYIYSAPDDKEFFFDRDEDATESRNLAANGTCGEAASPQEGLVALRQRLLNALGTTGWVRYPTQVMPADPDAGLLFQDNRSFREQEAALPEGYQASLR